MYLSWISGIALFVSLIVLSHNDSTDDISIKDMENLKSFNITSLDKSLIHSQNHFDPRSIVAIWVRLIINHLNSGNLDIKLPVLWNYLVDEDYTCEKLQYLYNTCQINTHNLKPQQCHSQTRNQFSQTKTNYFESLQEDLETIQTNSQARQNYSKIIHNYNQTTHLEIDLLKCLNDKNNSLPQAMSRFFGKYYLFHSAPIPNNIVLVGAGPENGNLVIPTFLGLDSYSTYIDEESGFEDEISLNVEIEKLNLIWNQSNISADSSFIIPSTNTDYTLTSDDFEFDLISNATENQFKFFHEANILNSDFGHHFDWRFFDKTSHSSYEKKAILHRLSRTWLKFANSIGLKTWLGHGTLLGWYWNGMSLPWDVDMDVQITPQSLTYLADNFNNSLVIDLTNDGSNINRGLGKFLLEVGPSFADRNNENGTNIIDARFIDIETGFYVDITAIGYTKNIDTMNFDSSDELNQVLVESYSEQIQSYTVSSPDLIKKWQLSKESHKKQKDIFNCRNNHYYLLEELKPLIVTSFEGVKALVPNKFKQILEREYPKGLRNYQFADHTYRPVLRLWVPSRICKKDTIGDQCVDEETLMEFEICMEATTQHKEQVISKFNKVPTKDLPSFRIDPWIIRRSKRLNNSAKILKG